MEKDEIYLKQLEALARLNEGVVQHSERYQNVVYGMFYAGFFALWFGLNDKIGFGFSATAALLMFLSFSGYAIWAVYSSQHFIAIHKLASEKLMKYDKVDEWTVLENASNVGKTNLKIYRYQPFVLYLTVGLASIAAISLISGLVHELLHNAKF